MRGSAQTSDRHEESLSTALGLLPAGSLSLSLSLPPPPRLLHLLKPNRDPTTHGVVDSQRDGAGEVGHSSVRAVPGDHGCVGLELAGDPVVGGPEPEVRFGGAGEGGDSVGDTGGKGDQAGGRVGRDAAEGDIAGEGFAGKCGRADVPCEDRAVDALGDRNRGGAEDEGDFCRLGLGGGGREGLGTQARTRSG